MAVTQIIKSVLFTRATFSKWEQRNIYNASGTVKDCCYHNISPIIASHSAEEFKYNEATKCKSLKIVHALVQFTELIHIANLFYMMSWNCSDLKAWLHYTVSIHSNLMSRCNALPVTFLVR